MKPCGWDTGYSFCPNHFVCKLLMMSGEILLIFVIVSVVMVNLGPLQGDATLCVV